jgi:RimJ/RimL family protein N-acetyltransferase
MSSKPLCVPVIPFSFERAALATDRLDLVPLVCAHADDLFPVLSDISLYEYTHEEPPASVAELRDTYSLLESRRSPDGTQVWLNWLVRKSGEAIGYAQATVTDDEADVAWVVGSPWQRLGFATEAAGAMISWLRAVGVQTIRAKIHPGHTASQRVAAKLGLSRTGDVVDGEEVWALAA